jgi:tetratricopeptide (TPR) repeat protein
LGVYYFLRGRPLWLQAYTLQIERGQEPEGGRQLDEAVKRLHRQALVEFRRAEQAFRKALELDAEDVLARNNLGATFQMEGQFARAEAQYRRVLARDDYHVTYYNLGNVHLTRKQWRQAEAAYREAIRRYPQNAGSHAQLAMALLQQSRLAEAEREAQEARNQGLTDHYIFEELRKRGETRRLP